MEEAFCPATSIKTAMFLPAPAPVEQLMVVCGVTYCTLVQAIPFTSTIVFVSTGPKFEPTIVTTPPDVGG